MNLITSHINADFDALGSLVAAKKLYPNSRLLLPGSPENAVREFLSLAKDEIVVESEKECSLDDIDRLVLVDTRHASRIGQARSLIDEGVEVHIYDHHPRMKGDIVADKDVSEDVGATVTILADIIKKKGIKLSPLEATIMLLGIYEETGSLTYRITTRLDVDMVSFLMSCGANLSMVSSYINRELKRSELSLLTRLINSTEKMTIKGIGISMIEITSESYIGELGPLIQKLMEIENAPVLFVLIDTLRGRVDIIGRSNIAAVDVNRVLSYFGGGGHPGAAAAKAHETDLKAVKTRLVDILKSSIKINIYAKDIMAKHVRFMDINTRIEDAKRILSDERLGGMPVVDRGRLAGIITSNGLNKAIKHGFGHVRIKGYMLRDFLTVRPMTPLHAIRRIFSEKDASIIPVLKKKKIVGIINRMDVLKNVYGDRFRKVHAVKKRVVLNLSKKMSRLLPVGIVKLLRNIGSLANSLGCRAFIVGGLVRDLLLDVKNLDLDIVVEGEAIKLGYALSKRLNAALIVHRRFGTCSVITRNKLKIDLATARREIYERPAALPTVEFSSLKDDLMRRDFAINAMAASLNKASFGQLIDFFNGERDLANGRIRVMHDGSFIDDPTRIFRAVRFEQRFGFSIEGRTEELIKNAIEIEMFDKVEPQRIRDEVILILKEEKALSALLRMAELDELRFLHPRIRLDDPLIKLYKSIDKVCCWYDGSFFKKRAIDKWLIYLMALFDRLSYNETASLCKKFVFRRGDRLRIVSYKINGSRIMKALSSKSNIAPGRIYSELEGLSFEVILLMMAKSKSRLAVKRMRDFFQKYNGARIRIGGSDLKALGLKPCPEFKTILRKVLDEKINGRLKTRRDELEYAKTLVGRLCK